MKAVLIVANAAAILMMATVVVAVVDPICLQPAETGMCRAAFKKYYFDNDIGHCREFIYGGCDGNDNRFDTVEECQQRCESTIVGCWHKGVEHPPGSNFMNDCNYCFCVENNLAGCTLMGCEPFEIRP